tara:strand:- start:1096 stop:1908 length:813 start_codon:yes stop_codon:yes gene_type:complete
MRRRYGERRTLTESTDVVVVTREDVALTKSKWGKSFGGLFNQEGPGTQLARMHKVGFEPYHVDIVHGGLFINIKGLEWYAKQKLGKSWGRLVTTLVPEADKAAYGVGPKEIGVIAHYYARHPVTYDLEAVHSEEGFGRASTVKGQQVAAGSSVETAHPYRMAQKRAQAACLRNVAPLGIDIPTADEGFVIDMGPAMEDRELLPETTLTHEVEDADEGAPACYRDDCDNDAGPTVDGNPVCEDHAADEVAKMVQEPETADPAGEDEEQLRW